MGEYSTFEISISTDNEGFALFRCPLCGELFGLRPSDYQDDGVFDIHCPACGLVSEDYFTDDVKELAMNISENNALYMIDVSGRRN